MIDGRSFFDQAIKNDFKKKIECLLYYSYFKKYKQ